MTRSWAAIGCGAGCKGPAGNPHAIGAMLELKAGGVTQRRIVMPTRSYLSQTEPVVTFGLGTATAIESLTVTWPDGTKQKVTPAGIDREITIEPNNESFSSLANTATAQLENGDFEEAIAILKQALDLQPDSAVVRRNLARAYLLGGQPDASIAELDKLPAAAKADSPAIAYLLGLAAIRQARYEDAIRAISHGDRRSIRKWQRCTFNWLSLFRRLASAMKHRPNSRRRRNSIRCTEGHSTSWRRMPAKPAIRRHSAGTCVTTNAFARSKVRPMRWLSRSVALPNLRS